MLSLLDLLAKRRDKKGQSGQILLNGKKRLPGYKQAVGYVVQVITVLIHCESKALHFIRKNGHLVNEWNVLHPLLLEQMYIKINLYIII